MTRWKLLGVLPVAGLLAAGCLDTSQDPEYGNLLTEPELFDQQGIVKYPAPSPIPVNGTGPSDPSLPTARGYEWDPDNPDPELNFHEIRSANASFNWHGQHQSTGFKASTYTDDVNGGRRHEHISSGDDATLFKPYGSSHITEGEYSSLYQ